MSGATLLRTLTKKSQLKFGQYEDSTVGQLMDMGIYGRQLLVYYYANRSMISFSSEVLDELGVTPEMRIPKPSVDSRVLYKWKDATMSEEDRLASWREGNFQFKNGAKARDRNDRVTFSKGAMASRNKGH